MERRARRELLVDEETIFRFYDERVPADVVSQRHFDRWWQRESRRHPQLLDLDPRALLAHEAPDAEAFPDEWRAGGLTLPLSYAFEPGSERDGVTVSVPLAVLGQVRAEDLAWQVPGLREEMLTSLIRSLPKPLRRSLVPAPDTARALLARLAADRRPADGEPLLGAVTDAVKRLAGVDVPTDAWNVAGLPSHLRLTFRVVDDAGGDGRRGHRPRRAAPALRAGDARRRREGGRRAGAARAHLVRRGRGAAADPRAVPGRRHRHRLPRAGRRGARAIRTGHRPGGHRRDRGVRLGPRGPRRDARRHPPAAAAQHDVTGEGARPLARQPRGAAAARRHGRVGIPRRRRPRRRLRRRRRRRARRRPGRPGVDPGGVRAPPGGRDGAAGRRGRRGPHPRGGGAGRGHDGAAGARRARGAPGQRPAPRRARRRPRAGRRPRRGPVRVAARGGPPARRRALAARGGQAAREAADRPAPRRRADRRGPRRGGRLPRAPGGGRGRAADVRPGRLGRRRRDDPGAAGQPLRPGDRHRRVDLAAADREGPGPSFVRRV